MQTKRLEKYESLIHNVLNQYLIIEGKNLIKNRLIDKFYLFKSPKNLPTSKKHQIFSSLNVLNSRYKKKYRISSKLFKDNITIYKK